MQRGADGVPPRGAFRCPCAARVLHVYRASELLVMVDASLRGVNCFSIGLARYSYNGTKKVSGRIVASGTPATRRLNTRGSFSHPRARSSKPQLQCFDCRPPAVFASCQGPDGVSAPSFRLRVCEFRLVRARVRGAGRSSLLHSCKPQL